MSRKSLKNGLISSLEKNLNEKDRKMDALRGKVTELENKLEGSSGNDSPQPKRGNEEDNGRNREPLQRSADHPQESDSGKGRKGARTSEQGN